MNHFDTQNWNFEFAVPSWLSRQATQWFESVIDAKRDELGKSSRNVMTVRIHKPFYIPWDYNREVVRNQAQIYIYAPGNYVTIGVSYGYEFKDKDWRTVEFESPKYFVTCHDSCWREGLWNILFEMFQENPDLYITTELNFRINEDWELVKMITDQDNNRYPKKQFTADTEKLDKIFNHKIEIEK